MRQHPWSEQLWETIQQLLPYLSKYTTSLLSTLKTSISRLRSYFSLSDAFEQWDKESDCSGINPH